MPFSIVEIFRSVEGFWLLWILSLAASAWMLRAGILRFRFPNWRKLHADDDGGAYTLSYVMAFPIFVLMVCLAVECTMILVVKMGSMYAAYAGARSAIVWQSARPQGLGEDRVRTAVVQSMAPFASADPAHSSGGSSRASRYAGVYQRFTGDSQSGGYLSRKYAHAESATNVQVSPSLSGAGPDDDITVRVQFESPLMVPGLGRLLGHRSSGGWAVTVESEAKLQNEGRTADDAPADKPLGIEYDSI